MTFTHTRTRIALLLLILLIAATSFWQQRAVAPVQAASAGTVVNFDDAGNQLTRYDTSGAAIDAHDGGIKLFNGRYYLYGSSYDCGFQWQLWNAAWCGFNAYSSVDLIHWRYEGKLFDPLGLDSQGTPWQQACHYGCFRPRVIFNSATGRYVLWINVLNSPGYAVLTSGSPVGPFVNSGYARLGIMDGDGDEDLFVDPAGNGAYIVYTTSGAAGIFMIAVEALNADYTDSAHGVTNKFGPTNVESPTMFFNSGTYLIAFSDPNCAYCSGTGTSYAWSSTPLGPWNIKRQGISTSSCGGQPSHIEQLATPDGTLYLYQSDLWNGRLNEANANYFWGPLTVSNGVPQPLSCQASWSAPTALAGAPDQPAPLTKPDHLAGFSGYWHSCAIGGGSSLLQTFTPARPGVITFRFNLYQELGAGGHPVDGPAVVSLVQMLGPSSPGPVIASVAFDPTPYGSVGGGADQVSWASRLFTWSTGTYVDPTTNYGLQISSRSSVGCFGTELGPPGAVIQGGQSQLLAGGPGGLTPQSGRVLKFDTRIDPRLGSLVHPVAPYRLLDTRATTPMAPGEVRNIPVGGLPAAPGQATGVLINLTEASATGPGFLAAYPKGGVLPSTSSLNWDGSGPRANQAIVKLGADGSFNLYNYSGLTNVVVDVFGWIADDPSIAGGLRYHPLSPVRAYDSRSGGGRLPAGRTLDLAIAGAGQIPALQPYVPATATAVYVNLTAVNPAGPGWLAAFPGAYSGTSNLNYRGGDIVSNHALVPLGPDRHLHLQGYADTDVVVDVEGWLSGDPSGVTIGLLYPNRLLDTRATGPADRRLFLQPAGGRLGIPGPGASTPARAVIVNLTVVDAAAPGYLTAYPTGAGIPLASDLNYTAGSTAVAGMAIVSLGGDGAFTLFTYAGNPQVIIDVIGWLG